MSASPSLSTALVHDLGTGDDGADAWLRLPRSDRRRLAMQAGRDQDAGALWSLIAAWWRTDAPRGGLVASGTLKNDRAGLRSLLAAWAQEDLLHPDPDAAATYVCLLGRRGLMPGTVANRLAAARGLYAALRWARAVLLDPFQDVHAPTIPRPRGRSACPTTTMRSPPCCRRPSIRAIACWCCSERTRACGRASVSPCAGRT